MLLGLCFIVTSIFLILFYVLSSPVFWIIVGVFIVCKTYKAVENQKLDIAKEYIRAAKTVELNKYDSSSVNCSKPEIFLGDTEYLDNTEYIEYQQTER